MIRPEKARPNSGREMAERRVAFRTACTVASVFFTRWWSSRTISACRS